MVFEPEVSNVLAEREQEGVVAIVPRAKERACLRRQMGEVPRILWLHFQGRSAVGDDVQRMRRLRAGTQINRAKVCAGDERRIHQRLQGHGREFQNAGRFPRLRQSGAKFPPVRQSEGGGILQLTGFGALGIEHDVIPTEVQQLRGGRSAGGEAAAAGWEQKIDRDLHGVSPGRHVKLKCEHVVGSALPREGFSGGAHCDGDKVGNRAAGRVLARQPFGVEQGERTGVRGNAQAGVQDFPRCVGGIDVQGDGCFLGKGGRGQQECTRRCNAAGVGVAASHSHLCFWVAHGLGERLYVKGACLTRLKNPS